MNAIAKVGQVKEICNQNQKGISEEIGSAKFDDFRLQCAFAVRNNPKLGQCPPAELLGAMVRCFQMGLMPEPHGHVALIPFKDKITVAPTFKGLIHLAVSTGVAKQVDAYSVDEADHFEVIQGTDGHIVHRVSFPPTKTIVAYYAVAKLASGEKKFLAMAKTEIEDVAKKSSNPIWKSHFSEMAKKTVIKRLFKTLPLSKKVAYALQENDFGPGSNTETAMAANIIPRQEIYAESQRRLSHDNSSDRRSRLLDTISRNIQIAGPEVASQAMGGYSLQELEGASEKILASIDQNLKLAIAEAQDG